MALHESSGRDSISLFFTILGPTRASKHSCRCWPLVTGTWNRQLTLCRFRLLGFTGGPRKDKLASSRCGSVATCSTTAALAGTWQPCPPRSVVSENTRFAACSANSDNSKGARPCERLIDFYPIARLAFTIFGGAAGSPAISNHFLNVVDGIMV